MPEQAVTEERPRASPTDDRPPFFRSWARLYAVVLGLLAFWIVVFSAFTLVYAPR